MALRRVTIREVASAAGVSNTTVSVVLSGDPDAVGISEPTRAAVLDAARRLGYRPDHAARSLRRRRSDSLTLLVQDLANPWFVDLAVAARATAEARGLTLSVVGAGPLEAELQALERLRGGASDGVIVATGRHGTRPEAIRLLQELVRRGMPAVVLIDRSPHPSIPAIRVDVEAGAYIAVRHLLALGHRRIGHVALRGSGPMDQEETAQGERFRGYRRALEEAGISFDPCWVVRGSDTLAGGREMVRHLIEQNGARPTALLVYNDLTSVGVLRGLYDLGIRVPADIAVVGTDGIQLGEFTIPALTTVEHPRAELGRLAVETLARLLAGEPAPARERVLEPRLVVRESCGA